MLSTHTHTHTYSPTTPDPESHPAKHLILYTYQYVYTYIRRQPTTHKTRLARESRTEHTLLRRGSKRPKPLPVARDTTAAGPHPSERASGFNSILPLWGDSCPRVSDEEAYKGRDETKRRNKGPPDSEDPGNIYHGFSNKPQKPHM